MFRYPLNPSQDFIKRVIGVPATWSSTRTSSSRSTASRCRSSPDGTYSYLEGLRFETLDAVRRDRADAGDGAKEHTIAVDPHAPPVSPQAGPAVPGRENCDYNDGSGFTCKVPAGHYFMMGDNRDSSDDSRYWGFVPDDHIRGKAFFIWFNWDDISSLAFKRVGSGIR